MRNSLILGALLLFAAAPAFAAPAARTPAHVAIPAGAETDARVIHVTTASGDSASQRVTLGLNKAAIVELDTEAHDVLVSSPDIVDAVVRSPRRIFLLGTKLGQTNAFFFDAAGHQILSVDVRVEKDVTDLGSLMKASLPNSTITVQAMNDNVILMGQVPNAVEATRANDLAASFTGDPKKVVNMLKVAGGEQVMLKVRIAEMNRSIAKQFGANISGVTKIAGTFVTASSAPQFGLVGQALNDLTGAGAGITCGPPTSTVANPFQVMESGGTCNPIGNNVQGVLLALEQIGLVHILAEPNLTAVSGETAKFLSGGEFPVPVAKDQTGNVTLQFKQFGVGLSFTPVVLGPGRISLQISTEDSELTNTGAFTLQGGTATVNGVTTTTNALTVPALEVRRAETTVELPSGGSFAIAGLMQHVNKQVIDGYPGLKDMPVLGALFRSRDYQDNETELVVLVSAYLVQPTDAQALTTPLQGYVQPTDPETLLLGRLNAVYKNKTPPVTPQAAASVGFVVR